MKEATIVYTAQFTNVVTDPQDLALIENNKVKELAKLQQQSMESCTNYDKIEVKSYHVFLHEDDE